MGQWVWIEEHWGEVVPYCIATTLLLALIIVTVVFWFRTPEPVDLYTSAPQVIVVQVPEKEGEEIQHDFKEYEPSRDDKGLEPKAKGAEEP